MKLRVVVDTHADEYSGAAAGERIRRLLRMLQCFPADFQQQALLRVKAAASR